MQQQQPKQPSQPVMPPRRPAGPGGSDRCPVIELKPGMKNLNTKVIVLDKGRPQKVQSGPTLQQFLVADATGMIYLTLYDEKAEAVDISDIIEIKDGYCSLFKGSLTLYVGKQGRISRVGEFTMIFDENVNVSHFEWNETSPGEYVRISREHAEQLPHHARNTYVIAGVPPNVVPQ